ncbi:hypothetical protein CDD81_5926 [Ophiocordyceps australis]|uniref:Uncharacterized protein n=1 Tax=Ophiocordyceps australis TaxID=1399860 RepID=A0A2C5YIJ3_9HYPO|nr:hypothetical protein CDD81_5926 [Ophiocordyceps australis]
MMPSWPSATQPMAGVSQSSTPASYAYPANPAFVPVQVRQSFSQHSAYAPPPPPSPSPPVQSQAASQQSKGRTEWPESVRCYVQRSFLPENDDASVSRSELEVKLKETIGTAKANDTCEREPSLYSSPYLTLNPIHIT